MDMKLRTKVTIATVSFALITAVAVGIAVYSESNALLVKQATENQEDHTLITSLHLKSRINVLNQDVHFLAGIPPLQGLIRSIQSGNNIDPEDGSSKKIWQSRLATILTQFLYTKPDYLQIRYIGIVDGGRELLRVERTSNGSIQTISQAKLQKKGQRRYFRETIQLKKGQIYFSEVNFNREQQQVTTPRVTVLRAALPIYTSNDELFGLIIINMDFHLALKTVTNKDHFKKNSYFYITNDRGDYLLHPESDRHFNFESGQQQRLQDDYPVLAPMFDKNNHSLKFTSRSNSLQDDKLVHFYKTYFDPLHPQRFIGLALVSSYQDVIASSVAVRNRSTALALLLITFGGGLAWFFSKRITQPLNKITEAAKKIATGQFDIFLPIDAGGELGQLALSFVHMAQQIHDRDNNLVTRANEMNRLNQILESEFKKRQRSEKQLIESNSRFEQFANNTTHVIWLADIKTQKTIYVNPAFEKIWGESRQELYSNQKFWMKKIHPNDIDIVKIAFGAALNGETKNYDAEYRIINSNKEIIWIHDHGVPITDNNGIIQRFAGVAEDITLRKDAERALQDSEENYRQIVENTNQGIIVIDPITNVLFVNTRMSDLLGFSVNELLNCSIQKFILHENYSEIENVFKIPSNQPRRLDVTFRHNSKQQLETRVCITSIFSGDNNKVYKGSLILVTDMSNELIAAKEQQVLQQQLQQAQKMESIGQLTGGIAHDFNNILSSVIGFTELSLEHTNNKDEVLHDYLSEILIAGERAQDVVKQMLTFSRGIAGKLKPLALSQMIKETIKLLRPTIPASLIITTEIDDRIPKINADIVLFHQLLMNLCINARDAMHNIGELTIFVYQQSINGDYCASCFEPIVGDYVVLAIQDSGEGITTEKLSNIFEPFFTTKAVGKGSGMGLSMVHGIIHDHHGHVIVHSEPGKGTRFEIFFPLNSSDIRKTGND